MKNALILNGSPRKNGNTTFLSEKLAEHLEPLGIKTTTCFLYDQNIKPCVDCRKCKEGNLECVIKDDMVDIYKLIEAADLIIFATPIYWFGPTAQTKLLIDRLRPFYKNKKLNGKKSLSITPAASGECHGILTEQMLCRICGMLMIGYLGNIASKAYDINDAKNDSEALHAIKRIAEKISLY